MAVQLARCDLCGAAEPVLVLRSERLDGPLVRCRECGLVYVGARSRDFTFSAADPSRTQALGDRVEELGIVARDVEEAEQPLREAADADRLARLAAHVPGGTLLDVGSATGSFLKAASRRFEATGIEPDPGTAERARVAGLRVLTGTVEEGALEPPPGGFDAVTMFHVIEHLGSPRAALVAVRGLMALGGTLVVETPTIDCLAFRLAPRRWRQLIPDHYFFFTQATLERLMSECGFKPVEYAKVGRRVSLRFAADRLRRAGVPLTASLPRLLEAAHLAERTVRINPGDIMTVVARAV